MRCYWDFYAAGKLMFGGGVIDQLAAEIQKESRRRPLIITDKNLANAGIVERVLASTGKKANDTRVFQESEAEPSLEVAMKAFQVAQEFKPDTVIGLGGGSNMDLAKMTALRPTWTAWATGRPVPRTACARLR